MAFTRLLVGILAAASLVTAYLAPVVPGAFVVEYEDGVDIESHLSSVQHIASTRLKLDYKLFKGASIRFHDVDKAQHHADMLATTPHVKKIWPVYLYDIPEYTTHWDAGEDATKRQGQDVSATRQAAADTFSPHVMTQVNRLRDAGFVGEGIKVAIVDTGVDYKHPDLGGCFGPGCLISFGYDLVGDAFNGSDNPIPGPDPSDCRGHGTHVAGIIAAQADNSFGVIGAATGVTLGAYRVLGCNGSSPNDVLISAFNMAYEDGADIITASVGGPSGWSEDPWSVVVSRIVENGVPCTLAAGNDGASALFYTSTAANGKRATAIGSFDNIVTPDLFTRASYTVQGGPDRSFGYKTGSPKAWGNVTLPLRAISFNTTDPASACLALSSKYPDLSGYIILVRRGTCTFEQKLRNLVARGAHYVLIYDNVTTATVQVSAANVSGLQAVGMVSADQGAAWIALLSAGRNVTVAMTDPDTASTFEFSKPNDLTGGYPSTTTTWGPTYEVDFKPQLAAPGGSILSTYPIKMGSYAVLSGTSMATPLVAAIYALLMDIRGTKDPRILENLLSSTSKPNLFNDGKTTYPILAPAVQQGSGLVQAYDAAYATTLLSVSSLSFNDTDNIEPTQNFTISNNGSESVAYMLRNVGAATGYTLPGNGSIFPASFPPELHDDYASIDFSDGASFTLSAGERKIVSVTATPPAGLDATRLPVYSGYIAINGSDGSSLSLPYVGVAGSLQSATVLDTAGTYLTSSLGGSQATVSANHTFKLPPPGHSNDTQYSTISAGLPQLVINLAFGSALVRVDVVPTSMLLGTNTSVSLGLKTLGDVFMTPMEYRSRGKISTNWDGRLSNGNYAPAGTYKLVVRALKIFGDRNKADQYERAETAEFAIRYVNSEPMPARLRRRQREWAV